MLNPDRKEFGPDIFQPKIVDLPLADSRSEHRPWLKRLPRSVRILYAVGVTSLSLLAAACGPEAKPPTSQPNVSAQSSESRSEISFEYPFSGLWYLTAGPHSDGLTAGVRAGLDFAQPEMVACPGGKPLDNRFVEASASGKVAIVGNEKDPNDKNHSLVEIDHGQGLRTGYMHLANIPVMVGQEVKQGERLGNPSCEKPPGGDTSGIHLHWYAKQDGKFLPADGIKFPQGQIKASPNNRDGILIGSDNLLRTADKRRCGPDENSIKSCEGIRNDLHKQAVLGTETPQPPIVRKIKICPNSDTAYADRYDKYDPAYGKDCIGQEGLDFSGGNTGINLKAGETLEISATGRLLIFKFWEDKGRHGGSCKDFLVSGRHDPDGKHYLNDGVCPPDNKNYPHGGLIGYISGKSGCQDILREILKKSPEKTHKNNILIPDSTPDEIRIAGCEGVLMGSHWKGSVAHNGELVLLISHAGFQPPDSGRYDITVTVYPPAPSITSPKSVLTPESVPPSSSTLTDKNPNLAGWLGGLGATLLAGLGASKLFYEGWKLRTRVAAGATTGTGSSVGSTPRIGGVAGTIGGPSNPNIAPSTGPTQPKSPEWISGQQEFAKRWQDAKSKLSPLRPGDSGNEHGYILERFKAGMNIVHEVSLEDAIRVPTMATQVRAGIEYLIPEIWPNNMIFKRFFEPKFNAGFMTPEDLARILYLPERYRSLPSFTNEQRRDIRRIRRVLMFALHPDKAQTDSDKSLQGSIDELLKKLNPAWSYIDKLIK